ncbi:MAG: ribosome recycling factor [Mariprofundales bacterium]|nr:ribosome recycling factor [Mariprofundales bacterium]
MKSLEQRMDKSIVALKHELASIRTGRANASLLDHVLVPYYGADVPLSQVASITVPEARMLAVSPWERTLLPVIEKALLSSDIGITPNSDGEIIRLILPELTEDRRKELVRKVSGFGEATKVALRNIRRDANDTAKKSGLSEDEIKDQQLRVQEVTDRYVAEVDAVLKGKEQDILTI